jgi:hypothetical protein
MSRPIHDPGANWVETDRVQPLHKGLSLRDYLAAHASEDDIRAQGEWIRAEVQTQYGHGVLPDGWRSRARYMHADEMLKARQQP